jgi:type IV pilus assembly protein PilA
MQNKLRTDTRLRQRGFSLIELLIVVAVLGIIAAIAIPNLLSSRRSANEASAISALRTLSTAEETYRTGIGVGAFGTLSDLAAQNIIDVELSTSTTTAKSKNGYIFNLVLSGGGSLYCAGAAPTSVQNGQRNFSSDTPGVVYVHPLNVATPPTTTAGGTPLQLN